MLDQAPRYLSTAQAVDYLAALGVITSRTTIDRLRSAGTLPAYRARGRIKFLYSADELKAAFLERVEPCSSYIGAQVGRPTTSAGPSRVATYMKALAAATA